MPVDLKYKTDNLNTDCKPSFPRADLITFMYASLSNYKFHIRVLYLPTYAQESCFKNIKIYIKIAPICFSLITIIKELIINQLSINVF
jgi:hypothetical protein